jgi:hypothetical protein
MRNCPRLAVVNKFSEDPYYCDSPAYPDYVRTRLIDYVHRSNGICKDFRRQLSFLFGIAVATIGSSCFLTSRKVTETCPKNSLLFWHCELQTRQHLSLYGAGRASLQSVRWGFQRGGSERWSKPESPAACKKGRAASLALEGGAAASALVEVPSWLSSISARQRIAVQIRSGRQPSRTWRFGPSAAVQERTEQQQERQDGLLRVQTAGLLLLKAQIASLG